MLIILHYHTPYTQLGRGLALYKVSPVMIEALIELISTPYCIGI